jgi:pyruvate dehydrogenase E1 component
MEPDDVMEQLPDSDPDETQEWAAALDAVLATDGPARARYLVSRLQAHAQGLGLAGPQVWTPYLNTIATHDEDWFPGDAALEKRIRAFVRWNAVAMVVRGNHRAEGLGGHLSTFASSATLYDVGFNHFFRGKDNGTPGDAVYFQGHASPGIYARAFLEGRLSAEQLDRFRNEIRTNAADPGGLSSYPHPRLMPEFWEYPTVSMGLGPLQSIYQARFNRYLHNRRIDDTSESRIWCFVGDGECDEPETLGAISLAGREQLDNLTWIINCNLQRLDGPVRGNGKIIQELEGVFRGAGWDVIKVIWGSGWDELLERDVDGVLVEKMNNTVDGEFQRYAIESGAYIREHFFGPDPRLRKLVEDYSDEQLEKLPRGGHDPSRVYAAFKRATQVTGQPTVILAKTIKGWALGDKIAGRNATHQIKKMTGPQLTSLRDRLGLNDVLPDADLVHGEPPYASLPEGSPEQRYLEERRRALGGPLPERRVELRITMPRPGDAAFGEFFEGSAGNPVSTTGAYTRLLRNLLRDPDFGRHVVPIIPDEARTFGMDALFREFKIYASQGQRYEPVDHDLLLSYRESQDGQLLQEGITEAGSLSSWIAAATSYAHRGVEMAPFLTFYSMFGFQRFGDLAWAAADARARGFLVGATAGRTTLVGEGLQHQDGQSQLLASVIPSCRAYDPAFAYELAVIIWARLAAMRAGEDTFTYLTVYNENYVMPPMPAPRDEVADGILRGIYRWKPPAAGAQRDASILFSGPLWSAAERAAELLATEWGIHADLWSVTSYGELRRDALDVERWNRLHPDAPQRHPHVGTVLGDGTEPVVAVSDWVRSVPGLAAPWIRRPVTVLGTDGFGPSDTRERLRRHFEVDAEHIVVAVLSQLARQGRVSGAAVSDAISRFDIETELPNPWDT